MLNQLAYTASRSGHFKSQLKGKQANRVVEKKTTLDTSLQNDIIYAQFRKVIIFFLSIFPPPWPVSPDLPPVRLVSLPGNFAAAGILLATCISGLPQSAILFSPPDVREVPGRELRHFSHLTLYHKKIPILYTL